MKKCGLVVGICVVLGGSAAQLAANNDFSVVPVADSPFKVIIFDLGDVIFSLTNVWHLPEAAQVALLKQHPELIDFFKTGLKKELWTLLSEISQDVVPNDPVMLHLFPALLANWLTGMTNEEAVFLVQKHVEQSQYSEGIKKVWLALSEHIFNPMTIVNAMIVIEPVAKLVRAFKEAGYQLYVLSNWDHSSYPFLQERHEELFQLFDGIVISGQEKVGKPNEKIYYTLLNRYELDPAHCVFIDDAPCNVKAGREIGIQGILMDSLESVYSQLQELGLIKVTSDEVVHEY